MDKVLGFTILIILSKLSSGFYIPPEDQHNITEINSFAFGSCYNGISKHTSRFDIFEVIDKNQPDFFMWIGDAAYVRYYSKSEIQLRYKVLNFLLGRWREFNSTRVEKKFNQTKHNSCKINIK